MMLPHSLNGDDDSILQNLLDDADADDEDSSMMLGAWVPVGSCSSLQGLVPTEVEIMGHKFAIWKADSDGDGSSSHWSVVDDECPHRMAPLSLGRIDPITQCLECPFHGWQFDCNGTVRSIPQLDELDDAESNTAVNHKKADVRSVRSFPTHVTGDLLWMFLPTSFHGESFPLTLMPEDYYQGLGNFMGPRDSLYASDLPFSFDFLVENGMDGPSHAYFAHHGLGFDRTEAGPLPCKMVVSNFTELVSEVTYKRKGQMRFRRYGFQRPFLVTNQQPTSGGGWRTAIIFFIVPIREGYSRLITTLDTLRPHPATPDWLLHMINRRFLEGDLMIHNAEIAIRNKQSAIPSYIHASSADTSTKAWRAWWQKYGLSTAPRNTFGPASPSSLRQLDRIDLVDPWRAHTSKCSKCRRALKCCKLIQKAGWAVAWSALALFRRYTFLTITLGLLGALTGWVAGLLIREFEGPQRKSGVSDRSLSLRM